MIKGFLKSLFGIKQEPRSFFDANLEYLEQHGTPEEVRDFILNYQRDTELKQLKEDLRHAHKIYADNPSDENNEAIVKAYKAYSSNLLGDEIGQGVDEWAEAKQEAELEAAKQAHPDARVLIPSR